MTTKTAAIRYARALFDVARAERADFDRIDQELAAFIALFDQQPQLQKVMLNPAVPVPRKRAAMTELTTLAGTSPMVTKLLLLLADRDRLIILPDLGASYRDRLNAYRKVVRAEIVTATPLQPAQVQSIEQRLSAVTGQHVNMQTKVDARIVGGLVAKIGSTVYDASVTRQLEKMKQRLVESV